MPALEEIVSYERHKDGSETIACARGDDVNVYVLRGGACVHRARFCGDDAYEVRAHPLHPGAIAAIGLDRAFLLDESGSTYAVPEGHRFAEVHVCASGFLFVSADEGEYLEARLGGAAPTFRMEEIGRRATFR